MVFWKRYRKPVVAVVGLGGTGSAVADILARQGTANLRLIDGDIVDVSNLHRQILYTEEDVMEKKTAAAQRRLRECSGVYVRQVPQMLSHDNLSLLHADLVLDCSDHPQVRQLINSYCLRRRIPWVFSAVAGTYGMVKLIRPGTPCLSCFLGRYSMPESSQSAGILPSTVLVAAALQARIASDFLNRWRAEERLVSFSLSEPRLTKITVRHTGKCGVCRC